MIISLHMEVYDACYKRSPHALWLLSSQAASALAEAPLQWRVAASGTPGTEATLYGVAALASGDAWAVGNYTSKSGQGKTLTERWDGTRFNVVSSPSVPNTPNILRGVSALSGSSAWAVGDTGGIQGTQTLTEHWNGTKWKIVTSPNPGSYNILWAVAADTTGRAVAAGVYTVNFGPGRTLAEIHGA